MTNPIVEPVNTIFVSKFRMNLDDHPEVTSTNVI
jgi:hypothetical protein